MTGPPLVAVAPPMFLVAQMYVHAAAREHAGAALPEAPVQRRDHRRATRAGRALRWLWRA